MSDLSMTRAEAEAFLADLHVGVLSIQRDGKGPLALPIWYSYEDGNVLMLMSGESAKAKLLRRHGRATMTVQDESLPYRYVTVEGPVTVTTEQYDVEPMATRYLGAELGAQYAAANRPGDDSVVARITPERWLSVDYSKSS